MMNMKKMLALLLAVVMVLGMIPFGAMAEEAETVTHIETCLENCALEDCACECHAEPETPAEPKQEENPVTPLSLDDTTTEETPVVDDTKTEETPVCTCTPVEGVHAEACALYVKPEAPVVPEEEVVSVDYAALYESIMNCDDLFAADALVDALTEEQLAAFEASLTEEQSMALAAHMDMLYDAANTEETTEEKPEEDEFVEHVPDIRTPTKDVTNAAPFLAPVEGPVMRMMRMFKAAPAAEEDENGLILSKSASLPDKNGMYTLTLEAYATGTKTIVKQEEEIPTDIILVLDQSGSMANDFTSIVYNEYDGTLAQLYSNRSNLYVKLENGSYSKVTVNRANIGTGEYAYTQYTTSNSTYYNNSGRFYHKCSDSTYGLVTVTRVNNGWFINPDYVYTYTCANGCTLGTSSNNQTPSFRNTFYQRTESTKYQYTFTYTKSDGTNETVRVMEDEAVPSLNFYLSQAGGSTTRLAALKTAVRNFADAVATKAKGADGVLGNGDDVDHTISVVGFGRANYSTAYLNTEVFIGSNQYKYGSSAQSQYANAPQKMNTQSGVNNVAASINALDAEGGTYVDLGIEMANGILNANPIPSGEKRNRVVIVFTDGAPGYNGDYDGKTYGQQGDAQAVADAAMSQVGITKNTHKATVYTVGIFEGANASSAGSNGNNASNTDRANYFMQRLSSNTSYPQTPSYYLSASDSNALNNIFQTISEEIENGGSSITLGESTVVKDIIADSFMLPANADTSDIKVYTDGVNSTTGVFNDTPEAFQNAQVTISGRELNVTNFNFSENWVGSETAADGTVTYRGKKLIIEIPIVPNPDFLGGNNVPTNGSASGVYNNGELVENFPIPAVDIDAKKLTIGVTTTDQNIYLTNNADVAALVTALDNRIDGTNNAYVNIEYKIMDGTKVIGTLNIDAGEAVPEIPEGKTLAEIIDWVESSEGSMNPNLDEFNSKTYTVVATAEPIPEGTAKSSKSDDYYASVNVFKPVVYFQDSEINAGATPEYSKNYVKVEWKNGNTLASNVTMRGTEPQLVYTYNPVAEPLNAESKVQITAVATTDQKTIALNNVTFIRNACNLANGCGHPGGTVDMTKDGYINFIVHLKTCDLVITKSVDKLENAADTFIFTVAGPNGFSKTVVINGAGSVTIADLPIGSYTVTEDTAWSWRYGCSAPSITKTIAPNNNTFAFTNTFNPDSKWLTDTSYAKNLFGSTPAVIK